MSKYYQKAGVNLNAGYESVELIKSHVARTKRKGMVANIGSFGGLFDLASLNYQEPILVSGTDGVGTKIVLAKKLKRYDTIGIDCVAMCVNDVLAQGAAPLFFLDYLAVGKNEPFKIEQLVKGVADGCIQADAALIGGETAEMPDVYAKNDFDIAGFCVGVVEKNKIIDGSKVETGDVLIGLASSGVHSNGFSLVRKIIKDNKLKLNTPFQETTLGDTLLTPTKIYVKTVLNLLKVIDIHGVVHITGGGFDENIPRVLKPKQGVLIDGKWPILEIFNFLEEKGQIPHREMFNIFNMGIGMVLVVAQKDLNEILKILKNSNEEAYYIGKVVDKEGVEII